MDFLVSLKFSYLLVPISVVIALFLTFIDSRINKTEYAKQDYFKISLLVFLISTFILYIHNMHGKVEEEILVGSPPF